MSQRLAIDYSKIPSKILESTISGNFISNSFYLKPIYEYICKQINFDLFSGEPFPDIPTSKYIQYIKEFIEQSDFTSNILFNPVHINKDKKFNLIDAIDFENSQLNIHYFNPMNLSDEPVQKMLNTQNIIFPITSAYTKQMIETIKISSHATISTISIENTLEMLKNIDKQNVTIIVTGKQSPEKLESTFNYIKNNQDFIKENNINIQASITGTFHFNYISEVNEDLIPLCKDCEFVIGSEENPHCAEPMSLTTYKLIREKLNDIVKDIPQDLPRKNKFRIIYTRLAERISYDEEATDSDTEYSKKVLNTSRNLINALLRGKCVCAGFAETLKQACSLVDIPVKVVLSKENSNGDSHAYNLVEIYDRNMGKCGFNK